MGEVATRLADRAVLTSDNPRSEDPLAIIDAVVAGARRSDVLVVEPDRRAAIALALDEARPGDVVVIAGKGHETTQVVGDTRPALRRPARGRRAARTPCLACARIGGPVVALLIAGGVALLAAILGTPILIRSLQARGIGQQIREDGPQGHLTKAGTPTMGGITIVGAAVVGYVAAHIRTGAVFTASGVLVILVMLGAGWSGWLDDWIKISRQRSLGLTSRPRR